MRFFKFLRGTKDNDELTVNTSLAKFNFVFARSGDDKITINSDNPTTKSFSWIFMGKGDDEATVNTSNISKTTIWGGSGEDTTTWLGGRLHFNGGRGEDTLVINTEFIAPEDIPALLDKLEDFKEKVEGSSARFNFHVFKFELSNGESIKISTFRVEKIIIQSNEAPIALDINETAQEDGPTITITADFTDSNNNDTHTFSIDTSTTTGLVTNNNDGTFTYDPNGQFESLATNQSATDTFKYTVTDNQGATSTAEVTVEVKGVNDPANVSSADVNLNETDEKVTTSGQLSSTDVDNDDNKFTDETINGTIGTLNINEDGNWDFTANSAFDSLGLGSSVSETYNVTSIDGTASTVKITINGTDDPLTFTSNASTSIPENQTFALDINANDPDGEGEGSGLTYSKNGGVDADLFNLAPNTGELTFISPPDYENPTDNNGINPDNIYEIQVKVTDTGGQEVTQDIKIEVTDVIAPDGTGFYLEDPSPNDTLLVDVLNNELTSHSDFEIRLRIIDNTSVDLDKSGGANNKVNREDFNTLISQSSTTNSNLFEVKSIWEDQGGNQIEIKFSISLDEIIWQETLQSDSSIQDSYIHTFNDLETISANPITIELSFLTDGLSSIPDLLIY